MAERLTDRAFYADSIAGFLGRSTEEIVGRIVRDGTFAVETTQRDAWFRQVPILREALSSYRSEGGKLYFEFVVPRLGKRIDVVVVLRHVVFVIEFKVGSTAFSRADIDQVCDYALDLKNFHETSHDILVAPVLVATNAQPQPVGVVPTPNGDGLLEPICSTGDDLAEALARVLIHEQPRTSVIEPESWEAGRYSPTPTIVEAALALYSGHSVEEISRSDGGAMNLRQTSDAICRLIRDAESESKKAICFVTGVPGAGKTLVGLDVATRHFNPDSSLYSVFLSGNGPLVAVLREALARDKVERERGAGRSYTKRQARSEVKAFIQNVHQFRDDCVADSRSPIEHVTLFDEAQRAWNLDQTTKFMRQKRKQPDFAHSEPEFLISCMDRHEDWAVVVCLVGGGQEINTGEAGISEWIDSVLQHFPEWHIHISPSLYDSEYGAGRVLAALEGRQGVFLNEDLHLGVSMRSFRAEHVSALVKALLDREAAEAKQIHEELRGRYPIVLTRKPCKAKAWMRSKARGSERYGVLVSSQAHRLKPHAIDVRVSVDPIHWFLSPKEDVRSSYYMEDVATEFHVQGLELDWATVVWDGDFRWDPDGWRHYSFRGDRWQRINKLERQVYLKNAYRVLLTRARQGMAIVVPEGDPSDPTRSPAFYDETFRYLRSVGLPEL